MVADVKNLHARIDTLINNAGIASDTRLVKMTKAQFEAVINVNLKGAFHCAQAVAETMITQGSGVILNTSSIAGIYGNFGQTNYAASKARVIGFTKTWARELGPKGIRVNTVCPGAVDTHIHETVPEALLDQIKQACWLRRFARLEEIASVYAFLTSDEASYVGRLSRSVAAFRCEIRAPLPPLNSMYPSM